MGLKGALLRPASNVPRLTALVTELAEVRFHAFGVIALFAASAAGVPDEEVGGLYCREDYRAAGEIFNQTLVDQAVALCYAGSSATAPPLLQAAAAAYFSGGLQRAVETRVKSDLQHIAVRKQMRINMVVALKNCMEHATPQHQRSTMRQLYGLTSKEATLVCTHVCTSQQRLRTLAAELHVKRHRRVALRKRSELDAAERAQADTGALRAELADLERALVREAAVAKSDPEAALASLVAEHPLRERCRPSGFVGPLMSLDEIVRRERLRVPETQSQMDQLRYRYVLLSRLGQEGDDIKAFNLTPSAGFSRAFVTLTREPAALLVAVPQAGSMADLAPFIFTKKALKAATAGGWCMGDSFRTDGIQVQFLVESAATRAGKAVMNEAKATSKRKISAAAEEPADERRKRMKYTKTAAYKALSESKQAEIQGQLKDLARQIKEAQAKARAEIQAAKKLKKPKKQPLTKLPRRKQAAAAFVLPEGATLVGIDTGIRNVFGCAREDDLDHPFAYSTATYRHEIGAKRRERQLATAERWSMANNPDFAVASDAVAAARTKTADRDALLPALQTRGCAYRTLYAFYGAEGFARHRFQNYIGTQRVMQRLVRLVAPTPTDVVVVGDAEYGSARKGLPPGVAGRFVKQLITQLGPARVVWGDEFRSSCLDSKTRTAMYHPPKEMAVNKNGKSYLRRVYGLYQSSMPGYSRTWNRDCNAAINIAAVYRHTYETGAPPPEFSRSYCGRPTPAWAYYNYTWLVDKNKFKRIVA